VKNVHSSTGTGVAGGILALLLFAFTPAVAPAQSARGHGEIPNGPGLSPSQISVDAWLDDDGVAQGTTIFIGDVPNLHPGGPADPWLIDVQDIYFDGNTAYVTGVVVHSVFPADIGSLIFFAFVDNSSIGDPDEICIGTQLFPGGPVIFDSFIPLVAGNITVND
jgi:hypothetical protein